MENGSCPLSTSSIYAIKKGIKTVIEKVDPYKKYILCLISLNILTHYLFIFRYSFVSDDWLGIVYSFLNNKSLIYLMLESQRPLSFVIYKVAVEIFRSNVFAFQILNLITTSLIILLVFLISKTLLDDVFGKATVLAFLVAILFCVFFNIDQIYLWSVMFLDNIAFIFYLSSFYFYINHTRKQYYFFLSILSFFIAIFIYELGLFLPLLSFCYDILFKRNWKNSLWFGLPLGIYTIIRLTKWFGLGWTLTDRNQIFFSAQFLQQYWQQLVQTLVNQIGITQTNILYGISGLLNLNHIVLVAIIILDGICIFFIFKYVLIPCFTKEIKYNNFQNAVKLFCIGLLGVLLSDLIIGFSGAVDTRHLIFIDFFIFLSIVALVGPILTKKSAVFPLFLIILICVIINQGLCVNWIIAGDICESVNQSITENRKNISPYNYVFVDCAELSNSIPNPGKNWEYNILKGRLYHPWLIYGYLNSPCLPYYIVGSMVYGEWRYTKGVHLIYGNYVNYKYTNVIRSDNGSLTYENMTTKTYHTINRSEYYQLNSTNLLALFYEKQRSDLLFLR